VTRLKKRNIDTVSIQSIQDNSKIPLHSADIPGKGTYSVFDSHVAGMFQVRILFIDRCRLEFRIFDTGTIDIDTPFKFMNQEGHVQELAWTSSIKHLVIPDIETYLEEGKWFSRTIMDSQQRDEMHAAEMAADDEIARIRTLLAIQKLDFKN